ncbi:SRPBCC domain-containing protein [Nannocystis sp.]|uniref:SRPBCC family protein n=1 Tax=Nannocystis sp. TaxID=1962667 RepID=UPI0025DE4D89|nr:SRPBCC domain-containing protein [Nannocystis sp.]MBK7827134.1 SRPBCC domain-containing protein [Nannocystis sp.]
MNAKIQNNSDALDEFVISREFAAPRALVFKVWTEAEHLARWWGPKGFTLGVARLDLRPGGVFHYSMRSPQGHEMWGKFVYDEISPPSRIVFVSSFSDAAGNLTRHPGSATWPLEVRSTLTFSEHQGITTITLRGEPINASADERRTFRDGHRSMQGGFGGTFTQLSEYLATLRG